MIIIYMGHSFIKVNVIVLACSIKVLGPIHCHMKPRVYIVDTYCLLWNIKETKQRQAKLGVGIIMFTYL